MAPEVGGSSPLSHPDRSEKGEVRGERVGRSDLTVAARVSAFSLLTSHFSLVGRVVGWP